MRFVRLPNLNLSRRSLVAGCCVALQLALVVGFPLPEVPETSPAASNPSCDPHDHRREAGQPSAYPCQHHRCGCRSAEQCWRSCCCFTDAQKLAWARARNVEPPEFVVVAARLSVAEPAGQGRSCCRDSATGGARPGGPAGSTARPERSPTPGLTWVLGLHAQGCRGLASWWLVSGATLPPPPLTSLALEPTVDAHCPTVLADYHLGAAEPPLPPPRDA